MPTNNTNFPKIVVFLNSILIILNDAESRSAIYKIVSESHWGWEFIADIKFCSGFFGTFLWLH